MQRTLKLMLLVLLDMMGATEAWAQWPDRMPALGPDSAQEVHDLLVEPGSPTDAFCLGFGVEGVEVSVDTIVIVLSQATGGQCRLTLGALAGKQPERQRLGGIGVAFLCGPEIPGELGERLYDALMDALTDDGGLLDVIGQNSLPGASPSTASGPEAVALRMPWQDSWQQVGVSILAGLLLVGILTWLVRRLSTRGAWKEVGLEGLVSLAAALIPRIGHPLYQDLFWSLDQKPWATTCSHMRVALTGHPASLPQSWSQLGVVASMSLVVVLGVFSSELYRKFQPIGTLHRWLPGILVLALPLNYVLSGGAWVVILTLALGGMLMNIGSDSVRGHSDAGLVSTGNFDDRRDALGEVLGGLGVTVAVAISSGLLWGLVGFGAWAIWEAWPQIGHRQCRPRGWPMVGALLICGLLMMTARFDWVPDRFTDKPLAADLAAEGTSLIPAGFLVLLGACYLLRLRSWRASAVLAWAVCGLVVSVGSSEWAFAQLLLVAVPGCWVLGALGIHVIRTTAAGREGTALLGIVAGVLLHHHLFQLFMRLAPLA